MKGIAIIIAMVISAAISIFVISFITLQIYSFFLLRSKFFWFNCLFLLTRVRTCSLRLSGNRLTAEWLPTYFSRPSASRETR